MSTLHETVRSMPLWAYSTLMVFLVFASAANSFDKDQNATVRIIDNIGSWLIAFPMLIILTLAYWWV